jgi:hypothetical protein
MGIPVGRVAAVMVHDDEVLSEFAGTSMVQWSADGQDAEIGFLRLSESGTLSY